MLITAIFAFLSGIITVLSPCVLPVLPFILSGVVGGKMRPFGIIAGFVGSFALTTLALSTLVSRLGLSPDLIRWISVTLLAVFGLVLLVPWFHQRFEAFTSGQVGKLNPRQEGEGFWGGFGVGAALGLLWTPCVGPVMAGVISLAINGAVNGSAVFITLAFASGTGLAMLVFMLGGRKLLNRLPLLTKNLGKMQRIFGGLMVAAAIGIFFGWDRSIQTWVLDTFPNWSDFLTGLEAKAPR